MGVPSVSVVMAVHNGKAFLNEAIESILNQTFRDFEFIIINDGSTDGSNAVLDEYASKDGRIRVIHQQNCGLTVSLNRGLACAKAPLIARMDGDDIALPDRLEKQVRYLQSHPELAALGSWVRLIDENGKDRSVSRSATSPWVVAWICCMRNCLWHPTMIIRAEWLRRVKGYDESFPVSQDFDLWSRLLRAGGQIAALPEVLVCYRVSSNQISSKRRMEQDRAAIRVLGPHYAWLTGKALDDDAIDSIWNLLGNGESVKNTIDAASAIKAVLLGLKTCENKARDAQTIRILRETAWETFMKRAQKLKSHHPKLSRKCVLTAISVQPVKILNPRTARLLARVYFRSLFP